MTKDAAEKQQMKVRNVFETLPPIYAVQRYFVRLRTKKKKVEKN